MVKKDEVIMSENIYTGTPCPVGHECYPDIIPLLDKKISDNPVLSKELENYRNTDHGAAFDNFDLGDATNAPYVTQCIWPMESVNFDAKAWASRWMDQLNNTQELVTARLGDMVELMEENGVEWSLSETDQIPEEMLDLQVYPVSVSENKPNCESEAAKFSVEFKIQDTTKPEEK